jgi:hypothetical protein
MTRILFSLLIATLAFASCQPDNTYASLPGPWRMKIAQDNASGISITKPASIAGDVDINFERSGIFTGKTPTNIIGEGSYSVGANRSLTIPCMSMTKVGETSWGAQFVNHIREAQSYRFEDQNILVIVTVNKTLTFVRL